MSVISRKYGASLFMLFAASALAGVVDAVATAAAADGSAVLTFIAVFALTTSLLVLASLPLGLIGVAMFRDESAMEALWRNIWRGLFPRDPAERAGRTIVLATSLALMLAFVIVVAIVGKVLVEAMRTTIFATISIAGLALAVGLILLAVHARIKSLVRAAAPSARTVIGRVVVCPASILVLIAAVSGIGVFLSRDLVTDILGALPLRQAGLVAGWLAGALIFGAVFARRRVSDVFRKVVLAGVPSLTAIAMGLALQGVGIDNDVRMAVTTDGILAPVSFRLTRLALDFDHDGYMQFLADGDCAPLDPNRSPGAKERPNNQVDEDCDGEDLKFDRDKDTFFGKWDFDVPGAIRSRKYNIFLLTIDAAAPAHMSLYGYKRPTTPNLEKIAKQSAWFKSAWAPGPSTRLAIPEVMTSKYGPQVERAVGFTVPLEIKQGNTTMAEILKRSGFRTTAILPTAYFSTWKGITQGFDTVDKSAIRFDTRQRHNHTGDKVTEAFIANLKKAAADKLRPVFMWAHFYDPHSPYTPVMDGRDFGSERIDLYDSELRYADEQIGKVVAEIDSQFDPAKTILIITADHGEAFDANHETKHHGHDLHSTILHVPLLIRAPFVKPGVFEGPVSTLDILPTLMNIHNIKGRHRLVGTSLVPQLVDGKDDLDRTIYSMFYLPENVYHNIPTNIMVGVRTKDFNYFRHLETQVEYLYKYLSDPFETNNLVGRMPLKVREMRRMGAKFLLWLAENPPGAKRTETQPVPGKPEKAGGPFGRPVPSPSPDAPSRPDAPLRPDAPEPPTFIEPPASMQPKADPVIIRGLGPVPGGGGT